jgi:hypothetical protein
VPASSTLLYCTGLIKVGGLGKVGVLVCRRI